MAPVVAEFQRICETCRNPFITAVRYPSIRPRRTCSRSCAARLPRRHQPLSERFWRYVTADADLLVVDRTAHAERSRRPARAGTGSCSADDRGTGRLGAARRSST